MIPALGLAALGSPVLRRIAIGAAVIAALIAGYFWWRAEVRAEAQAALVTEYRAATEAESERRRAVIEQARAKAEEAATRAAQTEKRNATLLAQINRLSASRDHAPCLDGDSVRRLNQIGRPPG